MVHPGSRFVAAVLTAAVPIGALFIGGDAAAQEDHAASRRIGDVTFLLPTLGDSAFVFTELGLRQGVTYEQVPNFPIGAFSRYLLQWAALDEQIDLSLRLTKWLGLFVEGDGSAAIGFDMPSLVFSPNDGYAYGGRAGVAIRVFRNERSRTQVVFRSYGAATSGRTLDLLGLFGAISVRTAHDILQIVSRTHDIAQLPGEVQNELYSVANSNYTNIALERTSSWTLGSSISVAQAIVGPLTLQESFAVQTTQGREVPFDPVLQDYVTLSSHDVSLLFDGVLSADFGFWGVPVGVSAEYAMTKTYRTIEGSSVYVPSSQNIGAGLFYTGRRGLEVGATAFTTRNLKALPGFETTEMSEKPVGYAGYLVIRALW
jgi:hypothetical protein